MLEMYGFFNIFKLGNAIKVKLIVLTAALQTKQIVRQIDFCQMFYF